MQDEAKRTGGELVSFTKTYEVCGVEFGRQSGAQSSHCGLVKGHRGFHIGVRRQPDERTPPK